MKSIWKRSRNLIMTLMITFVASMLLTAGFTYLRDAESERQLKKVILDQAQYAMVEISKDSVLRAKRDTNPNSTVQRELTAVLDKVSGYNNVAQAYIFGAELNNGGTGTLTIALSTKVLTLFKTAGLKLGDTYNQPVKIANSIKLMKGNGDITFSKAYKDSWGSWLTALCPIKGADGQTFAYLGIDADARTTYVGTAVKVELASGLWAVMVMAIAAFWSIANSSHSSSSVSNVIMLPHRQKTQEQVEIPLAPITQDVHLIEQLIVEEPVLISVTEQILNVTEPIVSEKLINVAKEDNANLTVVEIRKEPKAEVPQLQLLDFGIARQRRSNMIQTRNKGYVTSHSILQAA